MTFSTDSYWNRPLADAGVDEDSDAFIAWLKRNNDRPYLVLGTGDWAMPVYRPRTSTPLYTIDPSAYGPTVRFRLPNKATAMAGDDAAMVVLDTTTGQDVSLFEFAWSGTRPVATGVARYWLASEGLHERAGGTEGNLGHRGIPGSVSCVMRTDITRGKIARRLKIAIPRTGEWHCFPMVGHEDNRGGIIGEGIVLRLKPSTDLTKFNLSASGLIVARALRDYGVVVADNGRQATLKAEKGLDISSDELASIGWDNYEFVTRGWS